MGRQAVGHLRAAVSVLAGDVLQRYLSRQYQRDAGRHGHLQRERADGQLPRVCGHEHDGARHAAVSHHEPSARGVSVELCRTGSAQRGVCHCRQYAGALRGLSADGVAAHPGHAQQHVHDSALSDGLQHTGDVHRGGGPRQRGRAQAGPHAVDAHARALHLYSLYRQRLQHHDDMGSGALLLAALLLA